MAGLLEPTPSEDSPALAAPTEAASMEEEVLTEAAGDSSDEVIKP
jgi:hypothetical protein